MPKVFTRVSQREYARTLKISNEYVSQAVKSGAIKAGWDAEKKKIIVELANKEFGFKYIDLDPATINASDYVDEEDGDGTENLPGAEDIDKPLGRNTTLQEATRRTKIYEANLLLKKNRLTELELQEKEGLLVRKEDVFKNLFAFGQEMRMEITGIPDRVIDNIIAAKTRGDAYQLLASALHKALEKLTTARLDFSPRK